MPASVLVPLGAALAEVSVGTWIAIGVTVASMAYSYLTRPGAPPKADLTNTTYGYGFKINSRSTQEPIRILYGMQKVGGNIVFMETSGSDNSILNMIICLGEGPCDSINQVNGIHQVFVNDALYNTYGENVAWEFHSGSNNQSVDVSLNYLIPDWTDPMINTSYLYIRFIYDQNKFQNTPTVAVELKGKKLYDLRDGTTSYSNNPALVLYDYMTNVRYGMGKSPSVIDNTSWGAAADYCDAKGWTVNMAITRSDPAIDIRDSILSHFRGSMIWYDGKYYLRYADLNAEASVMNITDENIVEEADGKASISISESSLYSVPDAVRVRWIDPEKNYAEDDFIVGDDTGVVKQLDLIGCTDREQAARIAVYNLERWKLDRTITGRFRDDAIALEPHDIITLTSTSLGISSQLMRVNEANISPDGIVELILAYEDLALYDDDYNITLENIYTCSLPDPKSEPPVVSNASISEETYNYRLRTFTKLKISFDRPINYPWFKYVEVWQSLDNLIWTYLFPATSSFDLENVQEGITYYIRLKTVSIWETKQDDNNDRKLSLNVQGYIDYPSSLNSLKVIVNQNSVNVYADKVDDPDIELYEFRLGIAWSSAIYLSAQKAPNLSIVGVKPGNHTFIADTLSNNGNYGEIPVTANVSLIDPPDGWIVQHTETDNYAGR